jgi:hypothetical protein
VAVPAVPFHVYVADSSVQRTQLSTGVVLILAVILTAVIFSVFCIVLVWSQGKDEERTE